MAWMRSVDVCKVLPVLSKTRRRRSSLAASE
jgi:hypothetical protein